MGAPDFSKLSSDFSPIMAVDRSYGFLGTRLGTPFTDLPDLIVSEQREEVIAYKRPGDSLHIGQAQVARIEYIFADGKLSLIAIEFADELNGSKLRDAFSRVYGRGYGTDKLVFWRGEETDIIYTVEQGGGGHLYIGLNL